MSQLINIDTGETIELREFTDIGDGQVHICYKNERFIISGKDICVNNQRTDNQPLQHSDIISIGKIQYIFDNTAIALFSLDNNTPQTQKQEDIHNIKQRKNLPQNTEDVIRGLNVNSISEASTLITLYTVANTISHIMELDPLLDKILAIVFQVINPDKGSILLNKNGKLVPVAAREKGHVIAPDQVKISRSIIDEAVRNKEALLVDNAQSDARFTGMSILEQNIISAMCVPLMRKDNLLGVLQVDATSSNRTFTTDELALISGIGMQAALAVENVFLHEEVCKKERIEHEVKLASGIQQNLLPKMVPILSGIEVAGYMIPAKEVGGDYYDFIPGNHDNYYFTIGDVSGKGVPAGIIMAMVRTYIRCLVNFDLSVQDIITRLHTFFLGNVERGKFMSLLMLEWHNTDKKLWYSSAGHEHIVFYHAGENTCESIKSGGLVLGVREERSSIQLNEVPLKPGDVLVFYTDGVTEAMDKDRRQYTLERLVEFVGSVSKDLCAEEILLKILEDCRYHMDGHPQEDDITLLIFKYLG